MSDLDLSAARVRWSSAQGLDVRADESLAQTLERTGWVRTLGGLAGYLALSARNVNATVDEVHRAIAAGEIGVSPAVRGCIYLVPRSHAALALRLAGQLSARRTQKEREKLQISESELDALGGAILETVAAQPLTTAQLRKALPDALVRSLGPDGKKMGLTSTLPLALRRLEFAGRLRRRPVDHRIDHERYVWVPDDLDVGPFGEGDLKALASLYLRWAGPSTRKELAAWTGLKQAQAKQGLAACGARVMRLGEEEVFVGPDPARPPTGRLVMLPAMDNLYALRAASKPLVDPAYVDVEVANFGPGGRSTLGRMSQPIDRTLARDGEILGLWAWDPVERSIVTSLAPKARELGRDGGLDRELDRVGGVIAEVGHAKVFSIDSEAKLAGRAARLSGAIWPPAS